MRLLGSSMDKKNWSLTFLFSVERYGFKAFECGLIAPSLIRLWSVDLATFITSAIDRILVRRRKGIFESSLKSIWIHFRPPRFGNLQFTSATKFSSWEALPCCQILRIVLGLVDTLVAIWLMRPFLNFPFSLCLSNSLKIAWRSALLIIYLFIYLGCKKFVSNRSFIFHRKDNNWREDKWITTK